MKANKPLTSHWADITAFKLVKSKDLSADNNVITVASGISPSGTVHMGNFREVITADLVARSLRSLKQNVRLIHSWDNFDAFRKVPQNFPSKDNYESYLGKSLEDIPDPWHQAASLAQGRMKTFEEELAVVGIRPEYIYQQQQYHLGVYGKSIHKILQNMDVIQNILNAHRKDPLPKDWLPLVCYCPKCGSSKTHLQYNGEDGVVCNCQSCSHQSTHSLQNSPYIKLTWRLDWPMRWAYESVDFEPGGKDHSSPGGSFDTAKEIIQDVFSKQAPQYLPYDFVRIKGGGGKMSSSFGHVITLTELASVYEPQIIRWLYASQRPNHEFALSFSEDVIKVYEEFDHAEAISLSPPPTKGKLQKTYPLVRRTYELSCINTLPEKIIKRPPFRILCDHLQICELDIHRTLERFYSHFKEDKDSQERFFMRAHCARNWLKNYAPESFVYAVNTKNVSLDLKPAELNALSLFKQWVREVELSDLDSNDIHSLVYQRVVKPASQYITDNKETKEPEEISTGDIFRLIYLKLISKSKGPRLAGLLKELGSAKVLSLLTDIDDID
ncbi:MAG: lysine--tRNA ligase [Proteobacteria bacterium]|nr:lysine--tRNA ligase [Pseudomonadota bacterium]